MALLLSCWKKQKKFVIRKRPSGVFATTVTERDRAVWSPSPARAIALRSPVAPPGALAPGRRRRASVRASLCSDRSPRSPLALGGRRGGGGGGGAQHGQRPLWAGPWCWGALRVSTTEAQRGGRAPSLVTTPAPGVGEPGSRSQTRRSPPPQHPCGRRPARPALSVTGKVLALR